MTRPAPPWWTIAAAAPFLIYFALLVFCDFVRPTPLGLAVEFAGPHPIVSAVSADGARNPRGPTPASAARAAGVQPGDRLIAVDGQAVNTRIDWLVVTANVTIGRPLRLTLDRRGTMVDALVMPAPASRAHWTTREGATLLAVRAAQLITLVLAIFVLVRRPFDPVARVGAWMLATLGTFSVTLPYRFAAVWRELPVVLQALVWVPFVNSIALAAVVFTFFAVFPRVRVRSPWVWAGVWTPMALALAWHAYFGYRMTFTPGRATGVFDASPFVVALSVAYAGAGVIELYRVYRRLDDVNERRRVRVLLVGLIVGVLTGGPLVVLFWTGPTADFAESLFSPPLAAVAVLLFLTFPLSFAYAILRHRLFDLRIIIRQGVRYALARRLLLSIVPALAGLLALDVVVHADQPLTATLAARGWVYAGAAALAILAHARRREWLDALDRRFFRERYDAQRLLRAVADELRDAGDLERAAPRVVEQIHAALHSRPVALLVSDPPHGRFRIAAAVPPDALLPAPGEKLVGLLRVLGRPIDLGTVQTGWLDEAIVEERSRLSEGGIELLVPVPGRAASGREAVLALGPRRSEEPYSREDRELLMAVAASLSLALDRLAPAPAGAEALRECVECGTCYDAAVTRCETDGGQLMTIAVPRLLAGRYRLDRRLGRGGMGTVYLARDTALERRVAAKVLREDLVASAALGQRFEREARIAAGFAHPNVVTIHDFGVTDARRGFLVMELLEGSTLRGVLETGSPVDEVRTLHVMRGVCAAVEAAHRRALVHRDLKPENIFLARSEVGEIVKVLDFGIAKTVEPLTGAAARGTSTGVLIGTLQYMSPEQLRGEPVSPSWDLWALAVVACEMLMGVHPFAGAVASSAGEAREAAPFATRQIAPGWRRFFTRALALDPAERPPSAHAFLSALEEAIAS